MKRRRDSSLPPPQHVHSPQRWQKYPPSGTKSIEPLSHITSRIASLSRIEGLVEKLRAREQLSVGAVVGVEHPNRSQKNVVVLHDDDHHQEDGGSSGRGKWSNAVTIRSSSLMETNSGSALELVARDIVRHAGLSAVTTSSHTKTSSSSAAASSSSSSSSTTTTPPVPLPSAAGIVVSRLPRHLRRRANSHRRRHIPNMKMMSERRGKLPLESGGIQQQHDDTSHRRVVREDRRKPSALKQSWETETSAAISALVWGHEREAAVVQGDENKDYLVTVGASSSSTVPCTSASNLQQQQPQRLTMRLPTHTWHAKRFHMERVSVPSFHFIQEWKQEREGGTSPTVSPVTLSSDGSSSSNSGSAMHSNKMENMENIPLPTDIINSTTHHNLEFLKKKIEEGQIEAILPSSRCDIGISTALSWMNVPQAQKRIVEKHAAKAESHTSTSSCCVGMDMTHQLAGGMISIKGGTHHLLQMLSSMMMPSIVSDNSEEEDIDDDDDTGSLCLNVASTEISSAAATTTTTTIRIGDTSTSQLSRAQKARQRRSKAKHAWKAQHPLSSETNPNKSSKKHDTIDVSLPRAEDQSFSSASSSSANLHPSHFTHSFLQGRNALHDLMLYIPHAFPSGALAPVTVFMIPQVIDKNSGSKPAGIPPFSNEQRRDDLFFHSRNEMIILVPLFALANVATHMQQAIRKINEVILSSSAFSSSSSSGTYTLLDMSLHHANSLKDAPPEETRSSKITAAMPSASGCSPGIAVFRLFSNDESDATFSALSSLLGGSKNASMVITSSSSSVSASPIVYASCELHTANIVPSINIVTTSVTTTTTASGVEDEHETSSQSHLASALFKGNMVAFQSASIIRNGTQQDKYKGNVTKTTHTSTITEVDEDPFSGNTDFVAFSDVNVVSSLSSSSSSSSPSIANTAKRIKLSVAATDRLQNRNQQQSSAATTTSSSSLSSALSSLPSPCIPVGIIIRKQQQNTSNTCNKSPLPTSCDILVNSKFASAIWVQLVTFGRVHAVGVAEMNAILTDALCMSRRGRSRGSNSRLQRETVSNKDQVAQFLMFPQDYPECGPASNFWWMHQREMPHVLVDIARGAVLSSDSGSTITSRRRNPLASKEVASTFKRQHKTAPYLALRVLAPHRPVWSLLWPDLVVLHFSEDRIRAPDARNYLENLDVPLVIRDADFAKSFLFEKQQPARGGGATSISTITTTDHQSSSTSCDHNENKKEGRVENMHARLDDSHITSSTLQPVEHSSISLSMKQLCTRLLSIVSLPLHQATHAPTLIPFTVLLPGRGGGVAIQPGSGIFVPFATDINEWRGTIAAFRARTEDEDANVVVGGGGGSSSSLVGGGGGGGVSTSRWWMGVVEAPVKHSDLLQGTTSDSVANNMVSTSSLPARDATSTSSSSWWETVHLPSVVAADAIPTRQLIGFVTSGVCSSPTKGGRGCGLAYVRAEAVSALVHAGFTFPASTKGSSARTTTTSIPFRVATTSSSSEIEGDEEEAEEEEDDDDDDNAVAAKREKGPSAHYSPPSLMVLVRSPNSSHYRPAVLKLCV